MKVTNNFGEGGSMETELEYDSFRRFTHYEGGFSFLPGTDYPVRSHDAAGNVVSRTITNGPDAGGVIVYQYDALNRLVSKQVASHPATTFAYDASGRLMAMTDTRGMTTYGHDTVGRVASVTDPPHGVPSREIDDAGRRG